MPTAMEYEARIRALDWDGLRELWDAIQQRGAPDWGAGRAFEYLVLRAFELDGAHVRWPYTVILLDEEIEQIDGAVHYGGLSCLVESKDQAQPLDIGAIAKLRNQLLRRPAGTVGLIFSRAGFTNPARILAQFVAPQPILLWSGTEIEYVMQSKQMCEYLTLKYRACAETGVSDYDIRRGIESQ
jgi:Restriction endonuclease